MSNMPKPPSNPIYEGVTQDPQPFKKMPDPTRYPMPRTMPVPEKKGF